jgi:hypothetical protein
LLVFILTDLQFLKKQRKPKLLKPCKQQAFVPHFGMVAHAEEFSKHANDFSNREARRFAMLAKENGTWLSPTLVIFSIKEDGIDFV